MSVLIIGPVALVLSGLCDLSLIVAELKFAWILQIFLLQMLDQRVVSSLLLCLLVSHRLQLVSLAKYP
jgi:hypothetical protein